MGVKLSNGAKVWSLLSASTFKLLEVGSDECPRKHIWDYGRREPNKVKSDVFQRKSWNS